MKKKFLFAVSFAALALVGCSNYSARPFTEIPLADGEEVVPPTEFCAFEDFPQGVPFKVHAPVKAAKSTYGGAESLRPTIMEKVGARHGNAVANYHENQRFGFWPWRMIRPVASGDAITILNTRGKSCAEMGGFAF